MYLSEDNSSETPSDETPVRSPLLVAFPPSKVGAFFLNDPPVIVHRSTTRLESELGKTAAWEELDRLVREVFEV